MTFESEEEKAAYFEQCKKMDSNVITPGTEFMALLSSALRYYIHLRMNKDPGWRGVKVNGGGGGSVLECSFTLFVSLSVSVLTCVNMSIYRSFFLMPMFPVKGSIR